MEVRRVNRPAFDFGYLGPTLNCAGVVDFLPYVTVMQWSTGGGCIGLGWIFWYVTLEWTVR